MRSSSSLITTTLLFECRSIPLNFMWASFGLKRDSTLTLAPPLPRGEEARQMIIIRWRYRPAAGTRYVHDLSSAPAARCRAAAPAHCMRWPRPCERLHNPDCESLLLNEVP